jgi:hypothetical protein
MPVRINEVTVLNSFQDVVPKAAVHRETYLRTVAQAVKDHEPPVSMAIDTLAPDGFRASRIQCLVVEPTDPRLRHYRTAHYADPTGASLKVGWYLVGGEHAGGRQIGVFTFGGATALDADEVMSIVEIIHTYAVLPAIAHIADLAQQGSQPSGGFLGV